LFNDILKLCHARELTIGKFTKIITSSNTSFKKGG
jgi:hypothetical protein